MTKRNTTSMWVPCLECPGRLVVLCAPDGPESYAERHPRCIECEARTRETRIDPVAVDRLLAGHPPRRTTRAERGQAVIKLTERGWPASRIAPHLGISTRSVQRHRTRHYRSTAS